MLTTLFKIFNPLFLKNRSKIIGKLKKGKRNERNIDVENHANRILTEHKISADKSQKSTQKTFETLVDIVFADNSIALQFNGMKIRHTAMCGAVIKEIMKLMSQKNDDIHMMSYGDVELPDDIENVVLGMIARSSVEHMQLLMKYGNGYDLTSRGCTEARSALIDYFNRFYGFYELSTSTQNEEGTKINTSLRDLLISQCTIVNGGMRALDDFAATFVNMAFKSNRRVRFMSPDNSFPTWLAVIKIHTRDGELGDNYSISTDPTNRLHLCRDDVETFYGAFSPNEDLKKYLDVWCITPVGNPSGTAMTPEQLQETITTIYKENPDAIIFLDCAYVRTLRRRTAQALLSPIFNYEKFYKNVIVLESFSKTHGLCGERIGAFFTPNSELYTILQNYNTTVSSGNGRYKDALALTLATPTEEEVKAVKHLHRFWAHERASLFNYLMSDRFSDVFERKQSHITPDQLNEPLGIYIFLKLKKGIDLKEVFKRTKCLGVEVEMGSGTYVRFAVCKLKQSTFA